MEGMRRVLFLFIALAGFLSPKAQMPMPVGSLGFTPWQAFPVYHPIGDSSQANSKWYFSKYAAVTAGYTFYNGGGGSFLSAPVGIQLNHPLNNNLIAFAGVSAAPTFFSFSHAFTSPAYNKSYPGSYLPNTYSFGMNSRVEMGLMYINDARTFSISGSIGIEQSSYPFYPPQRMNTKKQ
jgi:hypothetical protein